MKFSSYLLITGFIFSAASCTGPRKMNKVSGKLKDLQSAQAAEGNKVNGIASSGITKLTDNRIDSNINNRIGVRLVKIQTKLDSINREISNLQNLSSDLSTFKKSYRKEIKPKLALLKEFRKEYDNRLQVYMMLEDGLNLANYTLFDLAAFFGPGLYTIPKDQAQVASKSFMPLIDSLISFSNKYQAIPRTATLVILGFADGQGINPDGSLYITLSNLMNTTGAAKEEMNKKLSELRALELITHLTKLFNGKITEVQNFNGLKVEYIGQGRGEAYPITSIKDYKEDDERRRIVLCYWSVLPDVE